MGVISQGAHEKRVFISGRIIAYIMHFIDLFHYLNCENHLNTNIMSENEIARLVFNAAVKVHRSLGPGLLESAYEECLLYELRQKNLKVVKQKALPLVYEDVKLDIGYRIDLLVEDKFIIEAKSVESLHDIHLAQILTYMRLSNVKLGALINFNEELLKNGFKRVINGSL